MDNTKTLADLKAQSKRLLGQLIGGDQQFILSDAHPIARFVESVLDAALMQAQLDLTPEVVTITGDMNFKIPELVRQVAALQAAPDESMWSVPSGRLGDFRAYMQNAEGDSSAHVVGVSLVGDLGQCMAVCVDDGPVYITKAQAMTFFDLEEKGAQKPPSKVVVGGGGMKGCTIHHLACGGIAFYYDVVPKAGLVMSADRARYPGGARPIPGTQLVCGSCLRPIRDRKDLLVDETIVELPALQPKPVD